MNDWGAHRIGRNSYRPSKAEPPADPPGPRKPSLRKYTWVRCDHDTLKSDLWGLVAEMAGSERPVVEAFVQRLEIFANGNQPRGSVLGFNVAALAVTWRCDKEELARIYAALEHHDVAWLDQDHIVTFWARNPDEEDPSSPARSKRYRDRRRIVENGQRRGFTEAAILAELEAAGLGYPPSRVVTRDAVTVTARAEQTRQTAKRAETEIAGVFPSRPVDNDASGVTQQNPATGLVDNSAAELSGETAGLAIEELAQDDAISTEALAWLGSEAVRIVVERMVVPPTRAATLIERWGRDLEGDVAAMVRIIAGADEANLMGARFHVTVSDQVQRHLRTARHGPSLHLPPVLSREGGMPAAARGQPAAESPGSIEPASEAEPAERRKAANE